MRILPYVALVLVSLGFGIFEVEGSSMPNLHRRWTITKPSVSLIQENNTIVVDYNMSDELSSDNVRTQLLTYDCEGPEVTIGIPSNTVDDTTGAHKFQVEVATLTMNETITTIAPSGKNATMYFCMRYALFSGAEEDAVEINYLYTYLRVFLDLGGDFSIEGFNVQESEDDRSDDMGDRHEKHLKERHVLKVYLCDYLTNEPVSPPKDGFGMGDVLRICTEASQSVLDDAMYLKGVDNFLWRRTEIRGGIPFITEQWAVKDGVPDGVSSYHCPPMALLCTFTTMLEAKFFTAPGFVEGIGSAALEFGARKLAATNDSLQKRNQTTKNLRTNTSKATNERSLQETSNRDQSNMRMIIPVKGPGERPKLSQPPVVDKGIPVWLLWLVTSLICAIIFGLAAYLYWKEWYNMETSGKH